MKKLLARLAALCLGLIPLASMAGGPTSIEFEYYSPFEPYVTQIAIPCNRSTGKYGTVAVRLQAALWVKEFTNQHITAELRLSGRTISSVSGRVITDVTDLKKWVWFDTVTLDESSVGDSLQAVVVNTQLTSRTIPVVGEANCYPPQAAVCDEPDASTNLICGEQCKQAGYSVQLRGGNYRPSPGVRTTNYPTHVHTWFAWAEGATAWANVGDNATLIIQSPTKTTRYKRQTTTRYRMDHSGSALLTRNEDSNEITVYVGGKPPVPKISALQPVDACMGTGDITLQSTTKANNKWYFAPGGSGGSLHIPLPLADSSWNPRTSQELWWAGKLRLISPVSNANGEFWVENQTPYCPGGPQVSNKIATNVQYAPPPLTISGPTPGPTKVCPNSANPDGIVKLTTDGVRPTRVRWYAREKFTGWTQDKNGAWVPIITPQNPPKLEWTGEKFDKAVAGTYYVTEDNPAGTCAVASPDYKVALDC